VFVRVEVGKKGETSTQRYDKREKRRRGGRKWRELSILMKEGVQQESRETTGTRRTKKVVSHPLR